MKTFKFEGKTYRSIRVFCKLNGISYQKMCRLRRHYVRAQKNPEVAARWLLGLEEFTPNEVKTAEYERDLELSSLRQSKFRDRMYRLFVDNF